MDDQLSFETRLERVAFSLFRFLFLPRPIAKGTKFRKPGVARIKLRRKNEYGEDFHLFIFQLIIYPLFFYNTSLFT